MAEFYNDDFNYDDLAAQLLILIILLTTSTPPTVIDVAAATEGASLLLTEVVRLVKLALVIPATSAAAERSFCTLRRSKTYIPSTVGQPRLVAFTLLPVTV